MPSYICETGCLWEESEGIYTPKKDFLAHRQGMPVTLAQVYHAVLCSDCQNNWEAGFPSHPLADKRIKACRDLDAAAAGTPEEAAARARLLEVNAEVRTFADTWYLGRRKQIAKLNEEKYLELLKARQQNREAYHGQDAPKNW